MTIECQIASLSCTNLIDILFAPFDVSKNSKLIKTVANKRCSLSDLNRCPFAGTDFKSVVSTYSTKRAGTYYGSSCKVMRRILDVLLANQLINIVALSMTNL